MNWQPINHEKEARGLQYLAEYCKQNGIDYRRASEEEDYRHGIDVYLNEEPYDVKISNENMYLSIFRCYKNRWYSPLIDNFDVRYLYAVEHEDKYVFFRVSKRDILSHLDGNIEKKDKDGNINLCVSLKPFIMSICGEKDWFVIKKG